MMRTKEWGRKKKRKKGKERQKAKKEEFINMKNKNSPTIEKLPVKETHALDILV